MAVGETLGEQSKSPAQLTGVTPAPGRDRDLGHCTREMLSREGKRVQFHLRTSKGKTPEISLLSWQ